MQPKGGCLDQGDHEPLKFFFFFKLILLVYVNIVLSLDLKKIYI